MDENCEYCGFPLINEDERITGLHFYCSRYFERDDIEKFENT
ncbi:MAG: hypothetical protein V3S79_03980 [Candidatus Thermoplasmatota archaeon]|jgi:hypothetical protein